MIRDALINPRLERCRLPLHGEVRSAWVQIGLLTPGSIIYRAFPIALSGLFAVSVPGYSGGPVSELHGVPFYSKMEPEPY